MLLEVHGRVDAGHRLLAVRGELDIDTAPTLAEAVDAELARPGTRFGLDLTELRFVDSSGVRELVHAFRRAEQHGRQLFLLVPAANRAVRMVFDLVRLETMMLVVDALTPLLPAQLSRVTPPASGRVGSA